MYKCIIKDGTTRYSDEPETLIQQYGCSPKKLIKSKNYLINQFQKQAEFEYRKKVKATAKFLDDVDAARKKK